MTHPFLSIIETGEYDHYGIRYHRGTSPIVGETLGKSRVWVDGECTEDELDGICTIKVTAGSLDEALADMGGYSWAGEPLVLVGGHFASRGEDDGELIIRDNICLAVA
jgi:hypothetical protein